MTRSPSLWPNVLPKTQITYLDLEFFQPDYSRVLELPASFLDGFLSSHIGNAGAKALAEILPQTQITVLKLGRHRIGDDGAKAFAAILPQTQITCLDLRSNWIKKEGAMALAHILPQTRITDLNVSGNRIDNEESKH